MAEKFTCAKAPCKSCPYRRDVPSGVWAAHEYEKLPGYDGEMLDQMMNDGRAIFMCHQNDGKLCAGWVATHGPHNLLALRMASPKIDPKVWGYKSPVPVFSSGAEAAAHGMEKIAQPDEASEKVIRRLIRKRIGRRA